MKKSAKAIVLNSPQLKFHSQDFTARAAGTTILYYIAFAAPSSTTRAQHLREPCNLRIKRDFDLKSQLRGGRRWRRLEHTKPVSLSLLAAIS